MARTADDTNLRVHVFIDSANVWQAQKTKGKLFDYQKLQTFLRERYAASHLTILFYTAYPAEGTRSYSTDGKHKFYVFLEKGLGFIVRKKELKRIAIHTDVGDAIEEKGNMDVEMTIDAVNRRSDYDVAVFFSGDSDFLPLITFLKNEGKRVYIYSSRNNISHELKTGGNGYVDILDIEEDIWGRDLVRRADTKEAALREEGRPGM